MKIKIVTSVVVSLLVCGVMVYVHASSDVSPTEPSISSTPEEKPLACSNEGCSEKAE